MIALLSIFGILLTIGTLADFILNILNLQTLPEKFLQVPIVLSNKGLKVIFTLDIPRLLNLHQHYQAFQHPKYKIRLPHLHQWHQIPLTDLGCPWACL